jgi:hypothetical protein
MSIVINKLYFSDVWSLICLVAFSDCSLFFKGGALLMKSNAPVPIGDRGDYTPFRVGEGALQVGELGL